jgi:Sigma-70 region 2
VEETEDFDSFYAAAFPRLVGQLALVTGDRHEAEDVVQKAMARAARWARLRAYDTPEAWVRRVAFNLAVSGHRRARRRLAALLRLGPPAPVPPVSVEVLALAEALQELADGYSRTASSPGPAAARRRGRSRRRRTAALVVLAGVVAVAVAAGLVPTLQATRPARPRPTPAPTLQSPGSTAWFRPTHVPSGYRRVVDKKSGG